jgi:hypothetical protein
MMAQGAATLFTSISAIGRLFLAGRLTVSEHREEAWHGTQVLVQRMLAFSDFSIKSQDIELETGGLVSNYSDRCA